MVILFKFVLFNRTRVLLFACVKKYSIHPWPLLTIYTMQIEENYFISICRDVDRVESIFTIYNIHTCYIQSSKIESIGLDLCSNRGWMDEKRKAMWYVNKMKPKIVVSMHYMLYTFFGRIIHSFRKYSHFAGTVCYTYDCVVCIYSINSQKISIVFRSKKRLYCADLRLI